MITTLIVHNRQMRCITTGMQPRIFAHSTVTDYLHETGCRIFPDGAAEPLHLNETLVAYNTAAGREEVYLLLPGENMEPLITLTEKHSSAETGSAETALRCFYRFFSYLLAARQRGTVSEDFFRSVLAAPVCLCVDKNADELIILPPQLMLRCVTAVPETALQLHYRWIHPDGGRAASDEAASFFLAAVSYALIAGIPPFGDSLEPFGHIPKDLLAGAERNGVEKDRTVSARRENAGGSAEVCGSPAEQLVQNIRDGAFVPISLLCPSVHSWPAALIDRSLVLGKKEQADGLPLFEQLCLYRDSSLPIYTGSGGTQTEVKAFIEKKERQIGRKRFFITHRSKIAAVSAAVFLLCTAVAALIVKINTAPETAGLSAHQVIQGFYTAVSTLDQAKAGAYTKNKAGAEYENLMIHLFVTEKMREVYEQKKIYYSPEEFLMLCNSSSIPETSDSADVSDTPVDNGTSSRLPDDAAAQLKKEITGRLRGGSIYGISHFSILSGAFPQENTEKGSGQFEIGFYYWIPLFPSEKTEELFNNPYADVSGFFPVQVFYYRDSIQIAEVKGSLFITGIEPLERTLIVPSSNELLEACMLSREKRPDYLTN